MYCFLVGCIFDPMVYERNLTYPQDRILPRDFSDEQGVHVLRSSQYRVRVSEELYLDCAILSVVFSIRLIIVF